jgi:hypothetical protein
MKAFIILLLTAASALAYPTGTVTRSVSVTTNGILFGSDTNFAALNGLSGTGSVAEVAANLASVSNIAISAVSSASVAQATADASVSSNLALGARMVAIETNHATAAQGVLAGTAWQNPASATNWGWASDGSQITLTNYTGPNDVVIPDMLDGLPVTGFGQVFNANSSITSVRGGANVTSLGIAAFDQCTALASVSLPSVASLDNSALRYCSALTNVSLPSATFFNNGAMAFCTALTSLTLPAVGPESYIDGVAFYGLPALTSVYFEQNAPTETACYLDSPNVTNYVTNPTATGWGDTFGGRPVVRLPLYGSLIGAIWRTNEVPGFGGTTNTIIYLGAP